MADGRTIAGVGLIAASVIAALVNRTASADEPPGGGPGDPPPGTNFEPVVFGDPQFQIDLVD